jgi:integrase
MRILDHDEVAGLAESIGSQYRAAIVLAAYCGLRFGEVAGLHVDALNLLSKTLTVSTSLNEVNGHLVLGPPKTSRSHRTLAMPAFVATELSRHIDQHPPSADGLVITGPNGGRLRRSNFRKRVWDAAVTASVGKPCTFRDLRHSHAALLIREGMHAKVIQERMGHASIRTTLDTYGHLFPGLDEAAAAALDGSVRGADAGWSDIGSPDDHL